MNRDLKAFLNGYRDPDHVIHDIYTREEYLDPRLERAGVYIFLSQDQKFVYPNGESKVIYIGMSVNLRSRLDGHRKVFLRMDRLTHQDRSNHWYWSRYQYVRTFGATIHSFSVRGGQTAKNLENAILGRFYDRFLALPVGNGAASYRQINSIIYET